MNVAKEGVVWTQEKVRHLPSDVRDLNYRELAVSVDDVRAGKDEAFCLWHDTIYWAHPDSAK